MDNFIVSARKYRPTTFQSVVGQQHITETLKNAIKNNQLAQAFLFCGPRGVGKTTCARILAKTINCENISPEHEACGVCDSCRSFQNGNSFNFHELDAASNNSVDDIRSLIEQVRIPPQSGKYKVYIIDEVHMLSQQAFNAFLKTLEEPPHYAIFILATTEKHKILPTILSRCQIFDFNRIRIEDMAKHLEQIAIKENIDFHQDGLHLIAQKADGGLRDALSMFDQIVSFSNKQVTYKAVIENLNILDYDYYFNLTDAILAENTASSLLLFDEILANGFDGNHFINGLASHFRNLLVGKDEVTLKLLEVSEGIKAKYLEQSKKMSASMLVSGLNIANQCDLNYKQSKNQRLQVELTLIKLCHMHAALNLSSMPLQLTTSAEDEKKKPEQLEAVQAGIPPPLSPNKKQETTPFAPVGEQPVLNEPEAPKFEKPVEQKSKISLSKAVAAAPSVIPNLNDFTKPREEEEKPDFITGESREPFSEENFRKLWDAYAEKMKGNSKLNMFTIMTSNPPVLNLELNIELIIENKIQENQLTIEKIDLLNYLRVELKNFGIEIITKYPEKTSRKKLYTASEKYLNMVEKNPNLDIFRKQFNLDIE